MVFLEAGGSALKQKKSSFKVVGQNLKSRGSGEIRGCWKALKSVICWWIVSYFGSLELALPPVKQKSSAEVVDWNMQPK